MTKPLFTGTDWTFDLLSKLWENIDAIGKDLCPVDYYRPQIEIISAQQMLEASSTVAMPIMYKHWSFGKTYAIDEHEYHKGRMGLAYEVVINTNPCLTYLMESNTATMQALVLAHAGCGHSGFFKNNYLFKDWTDAAYILDYLEYAKNYIDWCENKFGKKDIQAVLDAAHALQNFSIDKYRRPEHRNSSTIKESAIEWQKYAEENVSDFWDTLFSEKTSEGVRIEDIRHRLKLSGYAHDEYDLPFVFPGDEPEDNLLYFIEKYSINLPTSMKEVLKIVRTIGQYFYPQMQTKLMNEGYATFIHYQIMTELNDRGLITEGSYLEFLHSHSSVTYQSSYSSPHYSGINVYALGFAMFMDIKRICENPTKEDREFFPNMAGKDWKEEIANAVCNFKDESFILQYLSPKVIRDFKLFALSDSEEHYRHHYLVTDIHSPDDVHSIRRILSNQYNLESRLPQISIVGVDWMTTRTLHLRHAYEDGRKLERGSRNDVMDYISFLWGFDVMLEEVPKDRIFTKF